MQQPVLFRQQPGNGRFVLSLNIILKWVRIWDNTVSVYDLKKHSHNDGLKTTILNEVRLLFIAESDNFIECLNQCIIKMDICIVCF